MSVTSPRTGRRRGARRTPGSSGSAVVFLLQGGAAAFAHHARGEIDPAALAADVVRLGRRLDEVLVADSPAVGRPEPVVTAAITYEVHEAVAAGLPVLPVDVRRIAVALSVVHPQQIAVRLEAHVCAAAVRLTPFVGARQAPGNAILVFRRDCRR